VAMHKRVVITGMGVVTPLGDRVDVLYRNQCEGRSGVAPITSFDCSTFPTRFAAEVRDFDLGRYVRDTARWQDARLNSRFAARAASLALEDAGLLEPGRGDRTRFGVYTGVGEGLQDLPHVIAMIGGSYDPEKRAMDPAAFATRGVAGYHPGREFEQELHTS